MKDQDLKNIWNSLDDMPGIPISGVFSAQNYIHSRSNTMRAKIRSLLQKDLLLKIIGGILILLDIGFYQTNMDVLYVCFAALLLWGTMSYIQYQNYKQYNQLTDPAQKTTDNLSQLMVFIQRKSNLMGLLTASSQVLIFVPGLLAYFYIAYGYLKPLSGMDFFVFTTLCLIGTIMSYIITTSQMKYHIKQITLCLSDLSDDILQLAYSSIDKERKHDNTMKVLVGLSITFGFIIIVAVLHRVVGM